MWVGVRRTRIRLHILWSDLANLARVKRTAKMAVHRLELLAIDH